MVSLYIILLIASVSVASVSQIILKRASMEEHSSFIKEYLNLKVIIGYGLMFVSTVLTILAFRKLDYKNGPIIESIGYIIVMILSRIFLKEKITSRKVIGNCIILLGITIFYL